MVFKVKEIVVAPSSYTLCSGSVMGRAGYVGIV